MSSFGRIFRVTTYGESHAKGVGCIVEGVPPSMTLTPEDIQKHLDRRRPGQSSLTTARAETDKIEIQSGVENGLTLGTPIGLFVANQDVKKADYDPFKHIPRPGHADYTYLLKYGIKAGSGGGRSSARETVSRVAAGAIASKVLQERTNTLVASWVSSIGEVRIPQDVENSYYANPPTLDEIDTWGTFDIYERKQDLQEEPVLKETRLYVDYQRKLYNGEGQPVEGDFSSEEKLNTLLGQYNFVERRILRCPHTPTALKMMLLIQKVKESKDSIGGVVSCCCSNVPGGLGEPCFDKLEALLAHAMLSLPATKGFEIGSGFEGTKMQGSQHNDMFYFQKQESDSKEEEKSNEVKKLGTKTNNAGGTLGGISSGGNIYFRVAFKPVSTISLAQETSDYFGNATTLEAKGRHDPCVLPRAPPIVDAMAALVLVDTFLLQQINEMLMKSGSQEKIL